MGRTQLQFISDEHGEPVGVIVPISLWNTIESERETAYLLRSPRMKKRLVRAKNRKKGLSLGDACAKLGIRP